jgi:hypothetical protein
VAPGPKLHDRAGGTAHAPLNSHVRRYDTAKQTHYVYCATASELFGDFG